MRICSIDFCKYICSAASHLKLQDISYSPAPIAPAAKSALADAPSVAAYPAGIYCCLPPPAASTAAVSLRIPNNFL